MRESTLVVSRFQKKGLPDHVSACVFLPGHALVRLERDAGAAPFPADSGAAYTLERAVGVLTTNRPWSTNLVSLKQGPDFAPPSMIRRSATWRQILPMEGEKGRYEHALAKNTSFGE